VPLVSCYAELGEAGCVWEAGREGVGVCWYRERREGERGVVGYLLGDLGVCLFCEFVAAGVVLASDIVWIWELGMYKPVFVGPLGFPPP